MTVSKLTSAFFKDPLTFFDDETKLVTSQGSELLQSKPIARLNPPNCWGASFPFEMFECPKSCLLVALPSQTFPCDRKDRYEGFLLFYVETAVKASEKPLSVQPVLQLCKSWWSQLSSHQPPLLQRLPRRLSRVQVSKSAKFEEQGGLGSMSLDCDDSFLGSGAAEGRVGMGLFHK